MNYLEIRWQAGSTYFKVVHQRSEEHTSELQSRLHLVCRLLLEKKKKRPPASARPSSTSASVPRRHNAGTIATQSGRSLRRAVSPRASHAPITASSREPPAHVHH